MPDLDRRGSERGELSDGQCPARHAAGDDGAVDEIEVGRIDLPLLGRQLENLFPVAFLPPHQALAVAIMSYNGGIDFGLLADYDALPDLDLIVDGIRESLEELLEAARFSEPSGATPRVTSAGGVPRSTESPETAFAPGHTPGQGSTLPGEGSRPDGVDSSPASIVPAHRPGPKRGPAADMRARRSRNDRGGKAGGAPNDAPPG